MTTQFLTDREGASNYERTEFHFRALDAAGVAAIFPAATGVLCVISRVNLSILSLATVSLLFLVCLVSALLGLLLSFWMRPRALARSVRAVGLAWLAVCAWTGGAFVLQLAGFVSRDAL